MTFIEDFYRETEDDAERQRALLAEARALERLKEWRAKGELRMVSVSLPGEVYVVSLYEASKVERFRGATLAECVDQVLGEDSPCP